ncbi:MAG: hydrogenase iron-sulfur subunit [bacterium]|nr:hydrogenase iron-sulfur subunit [bacterium]
MNNIATKMYVFCCADSFDVDEFETGLGEEGNKHYKVITLPCSGKADLLYMIKAFETGADGVVVVTCSKGECRYLEGNLRAEKRAEEVNVLLEEIGAGKGRLKVLQLTESGMGPVIRDMENFREQITRI